METVGSWLLFYIPLYCQGCIGLAFSLSFFGKFLHPSEFARTVESFNILPARYSRNAALLILGAELLVVILVLLGNRLAVLGLVLAGILLGAFSIAIASALARGIRTSCNCFGKSSDVIAPYDLLRNVALVAFTLVALVPYFATPAIEEIRMQVALSDWLLIGLAVTITAGILANLHQIAYIVQPD
jgi:uncharacterized membrane protein YphA (DoxX/SURF4 family)